MSNSDVLEYGPGKMKYGKENVFLFSYVEQYSNHH